MSRASKGLSALSSISRGSNLYIRMQEPSNNINHNHSSENSLPMSKINDNESTRRRTIQTQNEDKYVFEAEDAKSEYSNNMMPHAHLTHPITRRPYQPARKRRGCTSLCRNRICVYVTFVLMVAFVIGAFFCWPRVPGVQIRGIELAEGETLLRLNPGPSVKMPWNVLLQLDNYDNWVPIVFKSVTIEGYDAVTNEKIGAGSKDNYVMPTGGQTALILPLSVNYGASSSGDLTIQNFINACSPAPLSKPRQGLSIRFRVIFEIWVLSALGFRPGVVTSSPNLPCPLT
ncbi:uncharacterized protein VTP21DRAFT_10777 [Calcarisporiella thermophila]|uniref:uncharacterized protein n=1 Tax=Calcarisporiella thermophila TaxID=911321 RepID=UPI0037421A50